MAIRQLALLAALALAGCVTPPVEDPAGAAAPASALPPATGIEAKGCVQAGGHSTYDKAEFDSIGILPEPWVSADVTEDLGGTPTLSSSGFVWPHLGGPIVGNYHVSVVCESYSIDGEDLGPFSFGFVTIRVEPPPFDTGGADRHYLITMLSSPQQDAVDLLLGAGVHATLATRVAVEPAGPLTHTVFDDPGHGLYESYLRFEETGEVPARVTRLWLLVGDGDHGEGDGAQPGRPAEGHDGGRYRPVAIDLVDTAATHWTTPQPGTFSHTRTADHAQAELPLLGPQPDRADGHIPGVGFGGFDRTILPGPQPDVVLDAMYAHL